MQALNLKKLPRFLTTLGLSLTAACTASPSENPTTSTISNPSPSSQLTQSTRNESSNVVRIGYVRWGLLPVIRQRGTLE